MNRNVVDVQVVYRIYLAKCCIIYFPYSKIDALIIYAYTIAQYLNTINFKIDDGTAQMQLVKCNYCSWCNIQSSEYSTHSINTEEKNHHAHVL